MNSLLRASLITIEGKVIETDCVSVLVHIDDSERVILFDHAPLLAVLSPGLVIFENEKLEDKKKIYFVFSGFIKVVNNKVVITADNIESITNITEDIISKKLENYKELYKKIDRDNIIEKFFYEKRIKAYTKMRDLKKESII